MPVRVSTNKFSTEKVQESEPKNLKNEYVEKSETKKEETLMKLLKINKDYKFSNELKAQNVINNNFGANLDQEKIDNMDYKLNDDESSTDEQKRESYKPPHKKISRPGTGSNDINNVINQRPKTSWEPKIKSWGRLEHQVQNFNDKFFSDERG